MRTIKHRRRGFIRRSAHALTAALAATVILLAAPVGQRAAEACGCKKPAIRPCSPSLAMWKHCKRVYTIDEPVRLDFEWRAVINPPCPPGVICIPCPPIVAAVATFDVTPIGGGPIVSTAAMPIAVVDGAFGADFFDLTPIGGLPWTPGIYRVTGKITVTLADGSIICATGDTCICLVEPTLPGSGVPILDIRNLTPDGAGGTHVHPGDVQSNTYEFTNNRNVPVELDLTATNDQRGNVPAVIPAPGAVLSPFSFADPGPGDDFPILMDTSILDPCLPLPPLPQLETNSFSQLQGIILAPGEQIIIPVVSRGWQLCETGSGCEQIVDGTATWTDGVQRDICVSGITMSNTAVPPAYSCPDSGATVLWQPFDFKGTPVLRGQAQPRPAANYVIDYLINPPQIFIDGQPVTAQIELTPATSDTCRIVAIMQLPAPLGPQQLDFFFAIDNFGAFPAQVLGNDGPAPFMPGIPAGFESVAPTTKSALIIDENNDGIEDSLLMNLVQLQAELVCDPLNPTDHGQALDLTNSFFNSSAGFGFNTMFIEGQTILDPCFLPGADPEGLPISEVHISIDIRSYAGGFAANPCFCDCDGNGTLNIDDIDCFVAGFLGGDLGASDCNGDGVLNIDDIDCFVSCFIAGCP